MASTNLKIRSGNRTVVSIDGQDIGLIQNVRMSDDYGHEAAYGIGDAEPQEHVPGAASYSVSVTKMVLLKDMMRSAGIFSENADDVLKGRVLDFTLYGKDENDVLRSYKGCSYVSGDSEVQANRIVTASAQFKALKVTGTGL
jgi:hypothetical protein